jgi:hypothetical protein
MTVVEDSRPSPRGSARIPSANSVLVAAIGLSLAFSDADDFMELVRTLPTGTVISGRSDDSL